MAQSPAATPIAFVDVNVAPMDAPRLLTHHDVLIRAGRIAALQPAGTLAAPDDALRIDGRGRYLLPGLADMHIHYTSEEFALLFLAYGVTTVRNMWGNAQTVARRAAVEAGEKRGPRIATCGPIVDGSPPIWPGSLVVETAEAAREVVTQHIAVGYDFLKVYENLAPEVYDALLAAAHERGLRVVGHVPCRVPLQHALAAGQASLEHLHGYFEAAQADDSPLRSQPLGRAVRWRAAEYADSTRFAALAEETAAAGVWNCPTLVVTHKIVPPDEREALLADPLVAALPPERMALWRRGLDPERESPHPDGWYASVRRADELRGKLVRALRDAGALLLLGTDTANPFVVPGRSLHEELRLLVAAGLTPFEALRAGTAGAAAFLGTLAESGTVAVGKRADLLLVEGDPLVDVSNAARQVGVVAGGAWLPQTALQAEIDARIAARQN